MTGTSAPKDNDICQNVLSNGKICGHTKVEHEFYETGHCSHYKEKTGGFIVWCKCEKFVPAKDERSEE